MKTRLSLTTTLLLLLAWNISLKAAENSHSGAETSGRDSRVRPVNTSPVTPFTIFPLNCKGNGPSERQEVVKIEKKSGGKFVASASVFLSNGTTTSGDIAVENVDTNGFFFINLQKKFTLKIFRYEQDASGKVTKVIAAASYVDIRNGENKMGGFDEVSMDCE